MWYIMQSDNPRCLIDVFNLEYLNRGGNDKLNCFFKTEFCQERCIYLFWMCYFLLTTLFYIENIFYLRSYACISFEVLYGLYGFYSQIYPLKFRKWLMNKYITLWQNETLIKISLYLFDFFKVLTLSQQIRSTASMANWPRFHNVSKGGKMLRI